MNHPSSHSFVAVEAGLDPGPRMLVDHGYGALVPCVGCGSPRGTGGGEQQAASQWALSLWS